MGTRAVVHCDLQTVGYGKDLWIATHWDGTPDCLGKDLIEEVNKQIAIHHKLYDDVYKDGRIVDLGSCFQKGVGHACVEHHIDEYSSRGLEGFDYGDFAEYLYTVSWDEKTQKVKVHTEKLSGEWRLSQPLRVKA